MNAAVNGEETGAAHPSTHETAFDVVRRIRRVDAWPGYERVREHDARGYAEADGGRRADGEESSRVVAGLASVQAGQQTRWSALRRSKVGTASGPAGARRTIVDLFEVDEDCVKWGSTQVMYSTAAQELKGARCL